MSKVLDIDKGWRELRVELLKLRGKGSVAVGILGANATADRGGISAAHLGAVHEYGASILHPGADNGQAYQVEIPQRSFLRATIDTNARQFADFLTRALGRVVDGKITSAQALGLLGQRVVARVRARIRGGVAPDIKPATKRRKGSSKPLVDSGQLLNSITYEVRE